MSGTRKFTFDRDLRDAARGERPAAIVSAEEAGYARGIAAAAVLAENAVAARLAAALERIASLASQMIAGDGARLQAAERDVAAFALAFARKLAGKALADYPLAPLEEAARECFRHLNGVPHLVVRINEALVEEADAALRPIAAERGFEGRIVVLGEADLAPGDAHLEWADGGMIRDAAALEEALAETIARCTGSRINP